LDRLPRLEIVGERQRTEIVTKRRADPRRHRQHRSNSRNKDDLKHAPGIRASCDLLADRRRHREHTWIAAGDNSDVSALPGMAERVARTRRLFAVVGRMSALAAT